MEGLGFRLSDKQKKLLKKVETACKKIRPYEEKTWISKTFNDQRIKIFGRAGLLGLPIDKEYGGLGVDALTNSLCLQRIGQEGSALRTFLSVHINIGQYPINKWGTHEQKKQYLPRTTKGRMLAGFALTEPEAGSDPSGLKTRFTKKGQYYVLNGVKTWIGNATKGDVFVTFAKDGRGRISAFIVEKDFQGFSSKEITNKMGYHNSDHGTITFKNCRVPRENMLGPLGRGLSVAYTTLINGRLSVASGSIGVMQDCLNECIAYSKKRKQWGSAIAKKQLVQEHLTHMAVNMETARGLVNRAAMVKTEFDKQYKNRSLRDQADKFTSMAKLYCTNASFDTANRAVQIFGSRGYTFTNRVARHFVDERATMIYEGTNEIHYQKIALHYLGKKYSSF